MTMNQLADFVKDHPEYGKCQVVGALAPKGVSPADMDMFAVCEDPDGNKVIAVTFKPDTKAEFESIKMTVLKAGLKLNMKECFRWTGNKKK